ncbi:MAG: ComF family protein [Holosporales bacterium]|jgi:ComF family protein
MRPSFLPLAETPLRGLLDLIFPFQCPLCDKILRERGLCGSCWGRLNFLGSFTCARCSFPLPSLGNASVEQEALLLCLSCLSDPPPFERVFSVFIYDEASRGLLMRLKHGLELSLTPLFSQWLFEKGSPLWKQTDLLIPVPLHWTRLIKRRFNQAAILAQSLEHKTGLLYNPFLLKRSGKTVSQGNLNLNQRIENVKGAFEISHRHHPLLQGARVTLIDDVYTTGATLKACAHTLLKGGAASVSALTLARVFRPEIF